MALLLVSLALAESYIPLESPTATEDYQAISNYAVRGYRFTALQDFTVYGAEWLLDLPTDAHIAVHIYQGETLLYEGAPAAGTGANAYHPAPVTFTFAAGQTYDFTFALDKPDDVLFTFTDGESAGWDVEPWIADLESVSNRSDVASPISTVNFWPARMRLVLDAPDADEDGSPADVDCDDGDPANAPGLAETCDGVDNDCDDAVDEDDACAEPDTAGGDPDADQGGIFSGQGADGEGGGCCGASSGAAVLLLVAPFARRRRAAPASR